MSDCAKTHIYFIENKEMIAGNNNTVTYFESEDCITEIERVEAAGEKMIRPKMAIREFGFVAMLLDTAGNTIGLHSRK